MPSSRTLDSPDASSLRLLRTTSLPLLLQREVERMILAGEIAAGDRLNESELAQKFGTSRGPIREALRALEESGLVRVEKNRGAFVRVLSVEEAGEIYEVRAALDELIGRVVAERATASELQALAQHAGELAAAAEAGKPELYLRLNLAFHDRLAGMTRNAKLLSMYRRLVNELSLFRREALSAEALPVSAREHAAIAAAIAARDAELAARLMREHVAKSLERMRRAHPTAPEARRRA